MSHESVLREMITDMGARPELADRVVLHITYVYPPIPVRSFDWIAYDDNTYDGAPDAGPQLVGQGASVGEAIKDFAEQLIERKSS
jgi:hypothetical protein